jgi:hypothetical protein
MDFAASTTAALDGLLTREGFMAGQGGDTEVIYCASHDELSDRFPRLPQANAQPRGLGCCVDLVIDQHEPGVQVVLEGEPLARTLRALHLDEAAQSVDGLGSMPLHAALESLVEVLPQLFRASKP